LQVWTSFEGQSLIRIQVLLALQRLVNALGARSTVCHPVVLPILRYSTDVAQPDEVNMLEDGMLVRTYWKPPAPPLKGSVCI
jgi:hypothetical protein